MPYQAVKYLNHILFLGERRRKKADKFVESSIRLVGETEEERESEWKERNEKQT